MQAASQVAAVGGKNFPKYIYGGVIAIWLIYAYATITAPMGAANQLNISNFALVSLRVSIVIPYLLTWLAAAVAYTRLRMYARAIDGSREEAAFCKLAQGVIVLLGGIIVSRILPLINSHMAEGSAEHMIIRIVVNYMYVVAHVVAFWLFLRGALMLARIYKVKIAQRDYWRYGPLLMLFVFVWLDLIFTNPSRSHAVLPGAEATYYLRDSLIILTIVLPSVTAWIMGIASGVLVEKYARHAPGVLYRKALSSFVRGTWTVILGSVFFQAVTSVGTTRLLDLGLGTVMMIIYSFLMIKIVGFYFMARGANKLTKLESV